MKKVILFVMTFIFLMSTLAYADQYFDESNLNKGYIGISCKADTKLKVMIKYGDKTYTYDLNNKGTKENFPLQNGNGSYKILLYKNTTGSSYKLLSSKTVKLDLKDSKVVYLNSVQCVNWASNPKTVEKAVELTKNTKDLTKKASIVWNYVVKNYKYDNDKLQNVPNGYVPVPDTTLSEKTGICYDFASLYASMLRSEGIPAKLVKGYAPDYINGYHAWNEVYDSSKKQWVVIDSTYDLQAYNKNISFKMIKNSEDFKKIYEY